MLVLHPVLFICKGSITLLVLRPITTTKGVVTLVHLHLINIEDIMRLITSIKGVITVVHLNLIDIEEIMLLRTSTKGVITLVHLHLIDKEGIMLLELCQIIAKELHLGRGL